MAYHDPSTYPRHHVPLYRPLSASKIRLLRLTPGPRRTDYTAQLLEVPFPPSQEYYSLSIAPEGAKPRPHRKRYAYLEYDDDTVWFPILSVGSGEHSTQVPIILKKAFDAAAARQFDLQSFDIQARAQFLGQGQGGTGFGAMSKSTREEMFEHDVYLYHKDVCVEMGNVDDEWRQSRHGIEERATDELVFTRGEKGVWRKDGDGKRFEGDGQGVVESLGRWVERTGRGLHEDELVDEDDGTFENVRPPIRRPDVQHLRGRLID